MIPFHVIAAIQEKCYALLRFDQKLLAMWLMFLVSDRICPYALYFQNFRLHDALEPDSEMCFPLYSFLPTEVGGQSASPSDRNEHTSCQGAGDQPEELREGHEQAEVQLRPTQAERNLGLAYRIIKLLRWHTSSDTLPLTSREGHEIIEQLGGVFL